MSTEYIEVNSAYRNRSQFPLASSFVVPIAQSGDKTAATAVDPISNAAPQIIFTRFATLTGTLAPVASNVSLASGTSTVIVAIPAVQNPSNVLNYYTGIIMRFTNGASVEYHRIKEWRYLKTTGGQNSYEVTLYSSISAAQQPNVSTISMADPTDVADPTNINMYIPNSVSADNFYVNNIIFNQNLNQWLYIKYYDGSITHLAQLDSTRGRYTPGTWLLTHTYILRNEPPIQYGQTIVGLTTTTATIVPLTPITANGDYVGNFIRLLSTGQIVRIIAYIASTNTITVSPAFSAIPAGLYEMLQFTRDNEGFLTFNNSFAAIREAVCYDISLVNVVLPNFTIQVAQGSRSLYYPYIYVEFRSEKNSDRQGSNSIISNNPNAQRALFRALLNDNVDSDISPFVRLDGNGMVQRIKLDPQSSYTFSVRLPDGSLFETIQTEYFSPRAPNPLAQISAMFSFERVMN
jgi:hypothetical protein